MLDTLTPLFSSLADATRQGIVVELAKGDRTVNQLVAMFELGQPTVSKHIKVLEGAGLVSKEVAGNQRICRLNTDALQTIETWVSRQRADWEARLDNLERYLDGRKGKA